MRKLKEVYQKNIIQMEICANSQSLQENIQYNLTEGIDALQIYVKLFEELELGLKLNTRIGNRVFKY